MNNFWSIRNSRESIVQYQFRVITQWIIYIMKKALILTLGLSHFIAGQLVCDFVNQRISDKSDQSLSWNTVNVILVLYKLISKLIMEFAAAGVSSAVLKWFREVIVIMRN